MKTRWREVIDCFPPHHSRTGQPTWWATFKDRDIWDVIRDDYNVIEDILIDLDIKLDRMMKK